MSDYIPKISYIGSSDGIPEVLVPLNIRHYYSKDEISLCFDRSDVDLVIYDDQDDLEKQIKEHDIFGISHPLSVVAQHIIQKQKQEQEQEQNNE